MFPRITTLDDLLPYISGWEEIRVAEKENTYVVRYMVSNPLLWTSQCPFLRECRGITFDRKTREVISRPYHKFFNVNEYPETNSAVVDFFRAHRVLEKLDGSMIHALPSTLSGEGFVLCSKSGETDTSARAAEFMGSSCPHYAKFILSCLAMGHTPIFEWCSNLNQADRIVLLYPQPRLVLTAIRNWVTGEYVSYDNLVRKAKAHNIDYVKSLSSDTSLDKLVEKVRQWEGAEGVVIRFDDDGTMFKIKALDYCEKHYHKDQINLEKNVVELILDDKVDDMLPLLAEADRERLRRFAADFLIEVSKTVHRLRTLYISYKGPPDAKTFALEFASKQSSLDQGFLYALHQNKGKFNLGSAVTKRIRANLATSTSLEKVKLLYGNLRWESY